MSVVKLPETKPSVADQTLATARRVLDLEASALQKLSAFLGQAFCDAVDMISGAEGRVIVTGMGKSGHVGKKIAATLASTGTPAFFIHPAEASHGDMGMIVRGDVVLALSNSGESKELNDVIGYTRRFAIPLIGVTSVPASTLAQRADLALLMPQMPEACPNGLAPTTSTTMALALGDALAITLLERKNFSRENYKDFHPGGKLGQQLMTVSDIMNGAEALPVCSADAPMADAVKIMTEKGFGCVALTHKDGTLAGLITDGDLRRNIDKNIMTLKACDIMTKTPKTTAPGALVAEALAVMNDLKNTFRRITCLIVVDADKKPVGILHVHDCLKAGFV